MIYAVNEEGVQALQKLSGEITRSVEEAAKLAAGLDKAVSDADGLGPHTASIKRVLETIRAAVEDAAQPAEELSNMLNDVAESYQEIIDYDVLKGTAGPSAAPSIAGNAGTGASGGAAHKSIFSRLFGKAGGSTASGSNSFSGMPISADPFREGMWSVSGPGHDAYNSLQDSLGEYTVDKSGYGSGIVKEVDLEQIEGIYLSSYDVDNPGNFWSQHDSNGTMESFVEIASHIPEVKSKLDSGMPLSELMEDPVLGTCAAIYFNPDNPSSPTLVEGAGFYELQSNGRHRIIAARSLGYTFPIRVMGRFAHK